MPEPIPQRMRAAVLVGPERVELRQVPVPEPAPDEILYRVEGCGICGSNLAPWQGKPWFRYPFAAGEPGHEGWGRVVAVGARVSGLHPGDRVAALSYRALAEYDVALAGSVVRIPPELDGKDVPGEALGCAMNVFTRSGVRSGHCVAVVGVGFLGALLVQLAASTGARVIALSRRQWSLAIARQMGAMETLPIDGSVEQRVGELTGGEGCDVVIEAAGVQATLDLAARLVRTRGRLVIAGYHQDGKREIDLQAWNWRGIDVVNAHERQPEVYVRGMRAAVEAVASGRLGPGCLYTHRYPLERAAAAFEALASRPSGFMKAQVIP